MGLALTSMEIILQYAGTVTLSTLVVILLWRRRTERDRRNAIQRFPLIVPAILFIVTSLLVFSYVPLPITRYHGPNQVSQGGQEDFSMTFTVYDLQSIYTDETILRTSASLSQDEYINVVCRFYANDTLITTQVLDLNATSVPSTIEEERTLNLDPGTYNVVVNWTLYVDNEPVEYGYLTVLLSQTTQPAFAQELVEWSTYQFLMNGLFFVLFIGGLCLGTSAPRYQSTRKVENEFRTYEQ
ncbi:MAG: hypothetical protein ACP6KW_09095 [Candidatus Thorarchaeota archaeon]